MRKGTPLYLMHLDQGPRLLITQVLPPTSASGSLWLVAPTYVRNGMRSTFGLHHEAVVKNAHSFEEACAFAADLIDSGRWASFVETRRR